MSKSVFFQICADKDWYHLERFRATCLQICSQPWHDQLSTLEKEPRAPQGWCGDKRDRREREPRVFTVSVRSRGLTGQWQRRRATVAARYQRHRRRCRWRCGTGLGAPSSRRAGTGVSSKRRGGSASNGGRHQPRRTGTSASSFSASSFSTWCSLRPPVAASS